MDKYVIGAIAVDTMMLIGFRIDSVINRSLRSNSRRSEAPSTDIRFVYWISDPIESRVVRSGPHPGTTGDIKPELYAHPADYER